MLHIHGGTARRVTARSAGIPLDRVVAVPIDTGKTGGAAMVCDFTGRRLAAPFEFSMDRPGVDRLRARVAEVLPADVELVRTGVEACGHYHRPLLGPDVLPGTWQLLELNPAWVAAQRRVNGQARTKTDPTDLVAIADLLLAGRGYEVPAVPAALAELTAWVGHRRRRVEVRRATKQQLLVQTDQCFPGLAAALSSVLGTKVGRLVVDHFADPARLASLGSSRFRRFAANRDVRVSGPVADRLVAAARDSIPTGQAEVARQVLTADLALLDSIDAQISEAEGHIARLVPATAYRVLVTAPGWGSLRAGAYAAAVGELSRWPSHAQVYRAAGLNPAQYESAGRRRDGGISREGSVHLRKAILDLGVGLWQCHSASRRKAAAMRDRGKPGAIITCALGRRANKIAYAMVRDGVGFDHDRWNDEQG